MKKSIKSILVLVSICATVSILLAVTNYITAPIIEANEQKNANSALLEVHPDGGSFTLLDISSYTLPSTVSEVYTASNGGYVIKLTTTGYSSGMVLMCGISADGTVVGTKLIASTETPSIGGVAADSFATAVIGKNIDDIDGVDTIAGATKTTAAYRAAVKDALNAFVILGGGSVELRTEEEIFRDNLNEALPAANGEFEKVFFAVSVEDVDAIYKATNGAGSVYVIGDKLIATDANGVATGECTSAEAAAILAAHELIKNVTLTDLDLSAYTEISSAVTSVKKTNSGSYVITVNAKGYSAQNAYAPADMRKPIVIQVSITSDGVIIDTLTLSQAESANYGAPCGDEKFYSQFDGKTEANYTDIDTISGATVTTNAYKAAILDAFKAVKIIEEVTE